MEVKIGIINVARELSIESAQAADEIEALVQAVQADGGAFVLSDAKGRRVVVPGDKLAYVDIGVSANAPVGFRS